MKSFARGKIISGTTAVENITRAGFWMFIEGEELFLSFKDFPMFLDATVEAIMQVEFHFPDHLYWPALDCDLELDSIRHLDRYPLVDRAIRTKRGNTRRHGEEDQ